MVKIRTVLGAAKKCTVTYIFDIGIGFYVKFGTSCRGSVPCLNSLLRAKMDVFVKVDLSAASGSHTARRPICEMWSIF